MRFRRLHIPAFGPFTDLELTFPNPNNCDLHLIYGRNEAGKSSLLRAIRDLLFGIHAQSPDGFLHDYKNLRLVGEIENKAGDHLVFQRRKGNKNTLLAESGEALPDSALEPFLGSVGQGYFSTMFGLGGSELREGARELLSGEGQLGNALFSASLGGTPIHRVLEELEEQSARIFRGRATTNVSIRPTLARYKEYFKQSRESLVSSEEWERIERDLESKDAEKQRLEQELAGIDKEIAWIERVKAALPSVGRLLNENRLLAELPNLPSVASDFIGRARAARDELSKASRGAELLANQIQQLQERLSQCATSPQLLAQAALLDVLHKEVGAYGDRRKQLAQIKTKIAGLELALQSKMESLQVEGALESLEALRLERRLQLRCESTAKQLREAHSALADNGRRIEDLESARLDCESELAALPETEMEPLRDALATAADAIDAHKNLPVIQASVESLSRQITQEHALVLGAPEDLNAASRLPIPARATIRKFRERFDDLQRERKAVSERIRQEQSNLRALKDGLNRLERLGELPTEGSLEEARRHRDHGWALVVADWKGNSTGPGAQEKFDLAMPLEEAYPQAVAKADRIADLLRLHAEAVAQAQEKRLQIASSEREIDDLNAQLATFKNSIDEGNREWEAEWVKCGIKPGSPNEMEEWREQWDQFRNSLGRLRELEESLHAKTEQVEAGRAALASAMNGAASSLEGGAPATPEVGVNTRKAALPKGDGITGNSGTAVTSGSHAAAGRNGKKSFSALFESAKFLVQKGEETSGRRKAITDQLAKINRDLEKVRRFSGEARADLDAAQANWSVQIKAAGLPEEISPEFALGLLRDRQELVAQFDTWRECSQQAKQIADSLVDFEERLQSIAKDLGFEGEDAEVLEASLWEALAKARTVQVKHDQLVGQIRDVQDRLAMTRKEEAQSQKVLDEILALGKLSSVEELEPLLAGLEKHAAIQERIDNLREALGGLARGEPLEEFIVQVRGENPDLLPLRKEQLENSRLELTQSLQTAQSAASELLRNKQALEQAGDKAAFFRQQAESEAAILRQDASRFLRLRLATHFLRVQVEQFRKKNQGPLLAKSGAIFKEVTRGAFEGLDADYNEKDIPVLIGRRADGAPISIEAMSEGTRDQLYLALRLAALDHHVQSHEPMPLILDDLLITFDNERSQAVLPILADLSTRTQIFLFTHHRHLLDLCRETLGEGKYQIQSLSSK